MQAFHLLLLAAAASAIVISENQPCSKFPLCTKTLAQPFALCHPDDEDCENSGSGFGSGSGSGSGKPEVCVDDQGRTMYLTCVIDGPIAQQTTSVPTSHVTTAHDTNQALPITTTEQVPTVKGTKKPAQRETTAVTITAQEATVQKSEKVPPYTSKYHTTKEPPVPPLVEKPDTKGTSKASGTKETITKMEFETTTSPVKTTTKKITTQTNKPNGNENNKAERGAEEDDTDKTWMIGVIVGCVIGSAILGVLAAIVVIKLKFSGQQSGSYQTSERGSTGSSSSQKPLYV